MGLLAPGLTCSLCFWGILMVFLALEMGLFKHPGDVLCRVQSVSQGPLWGQDLTG